MARARPDLRPPLSRTAALFGHPIGYSFVEQGQVEFEKFHNDELVGEESEFTSIIDELAGRPRAEGNDVYTTLDPRAQRGRLRRARAASAGSVVAIEPQTGKVRAMVSVPPYDPNRIPDELSRSSTRNPAAPLLNRATQSGYPPGSTMKVVTATAAIDSGEFTPDSVLNGDTGIAIDGVPLANSGGASFGPIDLTTALTNSVNTVWAQVGEELGTETDVRVHGPLRVQPRPGDRPARRRPASPSGVYDGANLLGAATTRSTSAGWRSARSGCWSRRCRWPRSRRRSPTAAS